MRDKPRSWRLTEADPAKAANVEPVLNKDRSVTLQEIAYQFSIGKASTYKILNEQIV